MKELGDKEIIYHQELADVISPLDLDAVYLYGSLTKYTFEKLKLLNSSEKLYYFDNQKELLKALRTNILKLESASLLFKGSHSMRLNLVVNEFVNYIKE